MGRDMTDAALAVSIEGRDSPTARPALLLEPFLDFHNFHTHNTALVLAFLNFLHIDIESSAVLTLLKSTRRCTGALLSSLSNTVLLQSSMASLRAVTERMKIRGTAFKPGLDAPKIEKI